MTPALAEEVAEILNAKPDARIVQRILAVIEREVAIVRQTHDTFGHYLEIREATR